MGVLGLTPRVDRRQAEARFRRPLRQLRMGSLAALADFYVPYRLFRVTITNRDQPSSKLVAIDALSGDLDFWEFDAEPAQLAMRSVSSDRVIRSLVTNEQAFHKLIERVKRGVYVRGFFRVKRLRIEAVPLSTLHLPYWVAIYRRGDQVRLEVMSALSGRCEGAKVRDLIAEWFRTSPASS